MISDIIIAVTLFVNAAAVLNFKLKHSDAAFTDIQPTVGDKVREFLASLQYFRVFIGIWNIFIMFLMLVVFG